MEVSFYLRKELWSSSKIVDYFDATDVKKAETIRHTFDNYEKKIFIEIQKLIR